MNKGTRPKGITILGWLYIIGAAFALIGLFNLKARLMAYEMKLFNLPENYYYVMLSFGIFSIVAGFVAGMGLLKTYSWGRLFVLIWTFISLSATAIFFYIYSYKYTIPYFISHDKPTLMIYSKFAISLGWAIFIYYYFNRQPIKAQFKKKEII